MERLLNAPRTLFKWSRHAVQFLYASRRILILTLLIGLLLGGLASATEPHLYSSTTVVSLEPQVFNYGHLLSMGPLVNNFRAQLESKRYLGDVIKTNEWNLAPADLADRITVEANAETFTLAIHVLDSSPARAAEIANALVDAFDEDIESINVRREQRDRIRLNVLQPASTPVQTSPHWERNLALGAIVGLIAGLVIGAVSEWRRRTHIVDPLDAEQVLKAPTLGAIPR